MSTEYIPDDHDIEVDLHRSHAHAALGDIRNATGRLQRALDALRSDAVFDVELEGHSGASAQFALSEMMVGMAALNSLIPKAGA